MYMLYVYLTTVSSFPPYHFDWIFNLSPMGRKFHHYAKILHDHSEKAINKRREHLLKVLCMSGSSNILEFIL